jgi:exonuclease V gamma subunit
VLAALLARNVRAPVAGQPLLAPEVVLIPQVAMRRWLQATLAAELASPPTSNSSPRASSWPAR